MSWINTLRTSAKDFGTLAANNSSTSYEPNDHFKKNPVKKESQRSQDQWCLIARSSERAPSALSSTASESPGKTRHESQSPLSLQTEMHDKTRRPVIYAHLSTYSDLNIDETWSSREWKSDELMDDRTGGLLFALKEERTRLKHVSLVNTRTLFWKKKKITIDRWNLLFAVMQTTSAQC